MNAKERRLANPDLTPEHPPCRAIRKEAERLSKLRDPMNRKTAKERLDERKKEIARAMSAGNGRKRTRLRRAREYAIMAQLGIQARLPEATEPSGVGESEGDKDA